MNNIIDTLFSQFGTTETEAIAQKVGAKPSEVQNVLKQFLPLAATALAKNASSPQGRDSLFSALTKDHDGSILGNLASALGDDQSTIGSKILGHVFGDKIGPITQFLGKTSGADFAKSHQIIQLAMPLIMGVLGKQAKARGFGASSLASMLTQSTQEAKQSDPSNMSLIGNLLDRDNDGNYVDDMASMGMNALKNWMSGRTK